jgi:hypothetical protein
MKVPQTQDSGPYMCVARAGAHPSFAVGTSTRWSWPGLGRIVALHYRSSALYQTYYYRSIIILCLCFETTMRPNPRSRQRVVTLGRVALSCCNTMHPLYTRFAKRLGVSLSEETGATESQARRSVRGSRTPCCASLRTSPSVRRPPHRSPYYTIRTSIQ